MDRKTRLLLIVGALAGPLFTIAWFVGAALKTDYDPTRHAISSISVGPFGWIQDASFLLTGLLTLALSFGVWSVTRKRGGSLWGPGLLVVVAIGFLGSGFFTTDPLNGYPPGTPPVPLPPTPMGWLHLFFAACIFGLPVACFVMAHFFDRKDERAWGIYSRVTGIMFLVLYSLTIAGFLQVDRLNDYAGVLQRISLTLILAWITLLPIHLLKSLNSRVTGRS